MLLHLDLFTCNSRVIRVFCHYHTLCLIFQELRQPCPRVTPNFFGLKKENFGVYFSAFNKFLGPFLTQNELLGCIFVKNQVTCWHDCVCTNMFWKQSRELGIFLSSKPEKKTKNLFKRHETVVLLDFSAGKDSTKS